jgi:hypothetical protein
VAKYNRDAAAGLNGFAPWSTYTSGAYRRYLQSTAPNTQLTDPGEYIQINATPAGTPASPAAAPGSTFGPPMPGSGGGGVPSSGEVVYEANTQTTEAFARGLDGRLDHTYLTSAGWQPWSTIGTYTITPYGQ